MLACVGLGPASAQISIEPAARATLAGRVLSQAGPAVAGARVRLEPLTAVAAQVRVDTDAEGRWRRVGLAPGAWRIYIEAEGFRDSIGKVALRAGSNPAIEVVLEIDSDAVVKGWLERGNEFLADGKPGAAQAFYDQAVTVVRASQAAPLHQALARTHFLQGEIDEAVPALQRAILLAPGDGESRELLGGMLASVEREREAAAWLKLLDGEGSAAAARVAFGAEIPERRLAEGATGRFRTRIDSASPYGGEHELLARAGSHELLGLAPDQAWSPVGESFEVYVPEGGSAAEPYGIFVWVSPTARGSVTDEEMLPVLAAERMIWIGANRSGNPRARGDRMRLALDAVHALAATYPVDRRRVYVGGYSGGGRIASSLTIAYPEVFTGGIYFMGMSFYRDVPIPAQPGALWGAALAPPPDAALELMRERSRFVFVTGTYDFNRAQTYGYRDEYVRDGLERVTLIEIPEVGHYYGFRAAELAASLEALDSALSQ